MPPHSQLAAVLVDHTYVHQPMRGHHVQLELAAFDIEVGGLSDPRTARIEQAAITEHNGVAESLGHALRALR